MATVAEPRTSIPPDDGSIVLHDISWTFYEQFLNEFDERRVPHSYVNGELRIMAPSARHESSKKILAQLVEAIGNELKLPRRSLGSVTLKLGIHVKGAEPDECYLLVSAPQVSDVRNYDPNVDPAPDLAVEVEVSSPSLNRLPVYAAMGIPEVWVYDGKSVAIGLRKDDDSYESSETSIVFPKLSAKHLTEWVERAYDVEEWQWMEEFREWVRTHLADENPVP